jgi:hypothetical protein
MPTMQNRAKSNHTPKRSTDQLSHGAPAIPGTGGILKPKIKFRYGYWILEYHRACYAFGGIAGWEPRSPQFGNLPDAVNMLCGLYQLGRVWRGELIDVREGAAKP